MTSSIAWSTRWIVFALGAVMVFAVLGAVTFEDIEADSALAIAGIAAGVVIMLGAMVVGWHRNKTLITSGFTDQLSSHTMAVQDTSGHSIGGPGFGGEVRE